MSWIKSWLDEPDQYEWVTTFLRERGLSRPARMLMAIVTSLAALTPLSVLASPQQATNGSLVIGVGAATLSGAMTWFWLTRWPTRRQSLLSAVIGTVCVCGWSLSQSSPALAALACTAGAVTGGYLAFFHSPRALLFNIAAALATAVVAAYRLAEQTHPATAVTAFWLMWLLNIAVPLAIRGTSKAMSQYAMRSHEDPLTGLLNRRGFIDAVSRRFVAGMSQSDPACLAVLMIDLDNFKQVNDTHGHAAGDALLLRIAELLRKHMPDDAAVCRAGGEEFLVAFAAGLQDASEIAAPLSDAIPEQCEGVGASIGVACADCREVATTPTIHLIDRLVEAADLAMYEAKRNGGNRVAHAAPLTGEGEVGGPRPRVHVDSDTARACWGLQRISPTPGTNLPTPAT